jgi:hypothetical protein
LPVLLYVSVYEAVPPGLTLAPPSLFVMERSGAAVTGVVSLAELFPGVGSAPFAQFGSEWCREGLYHKEYVTGVC